MSKSVERTKLIKLWYCFTHFQVYERDATSISTCAYIRAGVSGNRSYHPYFEYPRSVQDSTTLWAKVSARI